MTTSVEQLKVWLQDMAALIEKNGDPEPKHYHYFLHEPELAIRLIELLDECNEATLDAEHAYYSACVFALDICVAQLQSAYEQGSKNADKMLQSLMHRLSQSISNAKHSLSFWLPVLNAFYEAQVPLVPELKDAYMMLAEDEEEWAASEEDHLQAMRDLILEFGELSEFEIAENFFAQSYAMPADFYADLLIDLYSIPEGHEIALLTLLHPNPEVRAVVLSALASLLPYQTLSSKALNRLQVIRSWYPESYHALFDGWIKAQRKKGVVFHHEEAAMPTSLKASEIDGSGAQGVFIELRVGRKKRLCGLLYRYDAGIKDVWITPPVSSKEIKRYHAEAFEDSVTLRDVTIPYLEQITNHFLAVGLEQDVVPSLHLLEVQEVLGLSFRPQRLDVDAMMDDLAVQITPFTEEVVSLSLKRSQAWPKSKQFTESWFVESFEIDKYVNRYCEIIDGVKVCHFQEAMDELYRHVFELQRDYWQFHFLWLALWLKAKTRKNEKVWQDAFLIAHVIQEGLALDQIPIMREICYQSTVNSVETMNERRTHLLVEKK